MNAKPVVVSLTSEEAELLKQHLEHSVRTGGIPHARSAVPLFDKVTNAMIAATLEVDESHGIAAG